MRILLANITSVVDIIGGVERIFCDMANELAERGHEISLVYSDAKVGKPYFKLLESIKCYNLRHLNIEEENYVIEDIKFPLYKKAVREIVRFYDKNGARSMKENFIGDLLAANIKRVLEFECPDIIISFRALTTKFLVVDGKTNIPIVSMFHDDPLDILSTATVQVKQSLERSAMVQVLLPYGEKIVKKYCPKTRTIVIPNAIKQYDVINKCVNKEKYKIIYIARLAKRQKQQHLLVEAYNLLKNQYRNWCVELWGPATDAEYEQDLKKMIDKYGLEKSVSLCGPTDDVELVMRNGDIFAFTSLYEGFGITLAEAMSIGMPVLGIKDCLAVKQLVKDGETGILCANNPEDIAKKLSLLMDSGEMREKLGVAAHRDMQRYDANIIWNKWEKLIKLIVSQEVKSVND